MSHHSVGRLAALGAGVLATALAACSSSSTAVSTTVDLTGTWGVGAITFAGNPLPVDPNDTAILTCTKSTYHVVGTGSFQQALTDSGTYTATDTGTVSGAVVGTFKQQSLVTGNGATGTFRLSANKDTLSENVTTQAGVVASTWLRSS